MNSEKIQIHGPDFRYAAHVGRGLIAQAGLLTREKVRGDRAAIVTDSNIPRALVEKVALSLASASFQVTTIVIPPGEKSKSLTQVERICGEMTLLDRSSVVVGVGGGVVSDLSGFVAAVFHRGIPHVQIPTTLLAMVDSAIGGKTGVNLATGKNLAGAIHHPILVIADVDALATLPPPELRQGYAEIAKHAIIRDAEMIHEAKVAQVCNLRSDKGASSKLAPLIVRNIRIKAAIVAADDRDVSGERALLNFGHTVGHGIERASDFQIPHGECVSLGMVAACDISTKCAGLSTAERDDVVALLKRLGLPTRLPNEIAREKIIEAIVRDKKFDGGEVRFVVTPRLGEAYLSRDVTMSHIEEAVAEL